MLRLVLFDDGSQILAQCLSVPAFCDSHGSTLRMGGGACSFIELSAFPGLLPPSLTHWIPNLNPRIKLIPIFVGCGNNNSES